MSSPPDTPVQANADAELANASDDSADGGDGGGGKGGGGEGCGGTFEGLLRSLRSTEPGVRIPAQRELRSMRLCDPEQVATVVDVWRHSASEHVRADAGDVLLAVNPLLLAPHVRPVIDGLADCNSFARLAAVAMLQKMLGHGVLTPEVLRRHDEQLMGSLRSEHCDDVVRDLVGNELMTVAFEPGGLGAVGAQENYHAAAGGSSSGSGGGGISDSSVEQLRAILGSAVPRKLLLSLLSESRGDLNVAANRYFGLQQREGDGAQEVALGLLDGTLPQHPLAMHVASGAVAEGNLDGTLPHHPLAMRVMSGTVAPAVAEGRLDGTLPEDPRSVRLLDGT
mmetsp:Transcript_24973/g.78477  ORF Transcript_24973/g.78477 Transcript_24973/m.78477 type:complete len:338 (+) Transcript_24973:29-1042(+)